MVNTSLIREHMKVVGSDGQHVGTVDRVEGDRIKLTRSDPASGGEHKFIDLHMIDEVRDDAVCLSRPADEVRQALQ